MLDVEIFSKTLYGHKSAVNSVIELKIGDFTGCLASASDDRTVKVWNLATGKCLRTFEHSCAVMSVMQLHHGDFEGYLASVSWDHAIRIWHPLSGECVRTLKGHTGVIHSLIQISHGDFAGYLISASWDCLVKVWSPLSGECECTLSFDDDRKINFWPSVTGECIRVEEFRPIDSAIRLKYGEYTGYFLSVPSDCFMTILDSITGNCVHVLRKYICAGRGKVQLRNGNIAAGFIDSSIKVRDISRGRDECIKSLNGHRDFITSLVQLDDGLLISASRDNTIKIWNLYPQEVQELRFAQYILLAMLQQHKSNGDHIQLHADWYEVFNTLPEYFQSQYVEYLDNGSFIFSYKRWCNIL